MKESIRRWLSVAIIPATLIMLGIAVPAHATVYKCDNDTTQPTVPDLPTTLSETNVLQDSIIIPQTPPGGCVINVDLFARDQIEINVSSGNLDAKEIVSTDSRVFIDVANGNLKTTAGSSGKGDIEAGNVIQLFSGVTGSGSTGDIEIAGDIISNLKDIQTGNANILIKAKGSITVEDIKTNGTMGAESARSGGIQIDVNLGGSNGDIAVGGSAANIGSIDTRSKLGGGQNVQLIESGVRITNGTENSTGNMTVQVLNDIMVKNTESRAGRIELNTNKGVLTLAGGALDADGDLTNDKGAGSIYLFADTIEFLGDAVVTTSQSEDADGVIHQIILAADTIDFQFADDLQILSNGNGANDSQPATIYVLPQGGITSTSTDNVFSLLWQLSFTEAFFEYPGPVHFAGSDDSNLTIKADGDHTQIGITGDNILFNGKDVTVQARGGNNTKHEIVMGFFKFSAYDGTKGLQMDNVGNTLFNVRGFGGPTNSGGDIQIQVDKANIFPNRWNLRARGGANVGDGGTILFTTTEINVGSETLLDLNADASLNGVGDAQVLRNNRRAISFGHGKSDISIGRGKGKIQFSANGGGSEGNAGVIQIYGNDSFNPTVTLVNNKDSITASALGSSGNGGIVEIFDNGVFIEQENSGKVAETAIQAKGNSSDGIGGQIIIENAFTENNLQSTNVNAVFKVDGGTATGANQSGLIQLNNVFCFQTQSPFNDYPKTYWQCGVSGTSIFSTNGLKIATAANNLPNATLKSQLASTLTPENPSVHIYSMDSIDNFYLFFDVPAGAQDPGLVYGISFPPNRISATFDRVYLNGVLTSAETVAGRNEPTPVSVTTIRESTIQHELAHQLDYIWADLSGPDTIPPIQLTPYEQALATDEAATPGINFDSNGVKLPCSAVFTANTCAANQPTAFNFEVLQNSFGDNSEVFAAMFGLISSAPHGYHNIPELERALNLMSNTKGFVTTTISTPPTPQR